MHWLWFLMYWWKFKRNNAGKKSLWHSILKTVWFLNVHGEWSLSLSFKSVLFNLVMSFPLLFLVAFKYFLLRILALIIPLIDFPFAFQISFQVVKLVLPFYFFSSLFPVGWKLVSVFHDLTLCVNRCHSLTLENSFHFSEVCWGYAYFGC